jgi:hypothetical protein
VSHADAYGAGRTIKKGRGRRVCILGAMPRGSQPPSPDPAYLQHGIDDQQGLSVIAPARQAWLASQRTPTASRGPVPVPSRRRAPGRGPRPPRIARG